MNILSLDGGGIRGYGPAWVLENVEAETSALADHFDLVAGTSVGSILAAAVAFRVPMREARKLFETVGPQIFHRSWWQKITNPRGIRGPLYSSEPLQEELDRLFGDRLMVDSPVPLLIPAYSMTTGRPVFFKSYNSKPWSRVRVADAVMASSAAPTFFPPVELRGEHMVDGGVVANLPAVCAVADALRAFPGRRGPVLALVSLGTGRADERWEEGDLTGWGIAQWVSPIVKVLMDASVETAQYHLQSLDDVGLFDPYLRLDPGELGVSMDDASPEALETIRSGAMAVLNSDEYDTLVRHLRG